MEQWRILQILFLNALYSVYWTQKKIKNVCLPYIMHFDTVKTQPPSVYAMHHMHIRHAH